jgi:hypothetical protein
MAKRISQLTSLSSASIARDDELVIVDKSANQTKKTTVGDLVGNPDFGWVATGETWTYSAWDSTTKIATVTVPTDATTKYTAGMRVRFSQTTGGTKYGIIVDVAATTLYIYMGTDYTLNNEGITGPVYSSGKAPLGFPQDPDKWTRELRDTTLRTQSSPVAGTWYNIGSLSLTVGRGKWILSYEVSLYSQSTATGTTSMFSTLASAAATGDATMGGRIFLFAQGATNAQVAGAVHRSKLVTLSANTTYYLNGKTDIGSQTNINFLGGDSGDTLIRARCAYL